jgi:hypothetical protein
MKTIHPVPILIHKTELNLTEEGDQGGKVRPTQWRIVRHGLYEEKSSTLPRPSNFSASYLAGSRFQHR